MTDNKMHSTNMKNYCQAPKNQNFKANSPLSVCNKIYEKISQDLRVGESFFKQGELRLLHGDSSGVQFFDLALQLDPQNEHLQYNQGLSLLEFGVENSKPEFLLLANKRFKSATTLNPSLFEAWVAWGNTLYTLGKTTSQHHYYIDAEIRFKKALSIAKGQSDDVLADLHWSYANTWSAVSKKSKEPSEMQIAFDSYQKAQMALSDQPIEFWHDFGHICLDLAAKMNDLRYFLQAINCYKNAVSLSISSFESWLLLSEGLSCLYYFTHDEDHFLQANECFATALQLQSKNASLWHNWAKILCESGKNLKDTKRVKSAIEKCQRASSLDPKNLYIKATWAEALALLGLLNDKIGTIYEAQNKIIKVINKKEDPELYYSYGYCLYCLGIYFNDLDYLYQAVEKYQEGLSLNRTYHKLWHALGHTHTKIGILEDNNQVFDRAHKFYQKAISLQANSLYYFDYAFSLFTLGEIISCEKAYEAAKVYFELSLSLQKNAVYQQPAWLFYYGLTLEHLAEYQDCKELYEKALEILQHVLTVDPEYPKIHQHLGVCYSHYASVEDEVEFYAKAMHHFKLANKREDEDDQILLDWALCLAAYADHLGSDKDKEPFFKEAEFKMTQAAKLGNVHAYFHLACLYSLLEHTEKAMLFLRKAEECDILPPIDELLEDDWLEPLRKTEAFHTFLAYLEEKTNLKD